MMVNTSLINQREGSSKIVINVFWSLMNPSNIDQGQIHPNYTFSYHTELVKL